MGQPALVVVDIQQDYFPGGAMPLVDPERAAAAAQRALAQARRWGLQIVMVQHVAEGPDAAFFRPDTEGVRFHPAFEPTAHDVHVVKHYPNAFRETPLQQILQARGTQHVVLVGMMTHMCIDTTARAACDLGYRVTLLGDATATRSLEHGGRSVPADAVATAYLAALAGTFATVTTADEWAAAGP